MHSENQTKVTINNMPDESFISIENLAKLRPSHNNSYFTVPYYIQDTI